MRRKILLLATLAVLSPLVALSSGAALAHGPHIGVHGGQQTAAGSFHVEVVADGKTLTIYLVDHAAHEIATAGFQGVALAEADDKTLTIALTPAGGNKLSGAAETPLAAEFKGIVRITTATGSTTQAKF